MRHTSLHIDCSSSPPKAVGDSCLVPTAVLRELALSIRVADMQEELYNSGPSSVKRPGSKGPPIKFQRLQKLNPKGVGALAYLNHGNQLATSTADVDQAVRATRKVWTEPPPALTQPVLDLLHMHRNQTEPCNRMQFPPLSLYISTILSTSDSAAGFD